MVGDHRGLRRSRRRRYHEVLVDLGKPDGTNLNAWTQPFALLALGLVFAAEGLGISHLLGSDVRGRAADSVATIKARQAVAVAMLGEARKAYQPSGEDEWVTMSLPGLAAKNTAMSAAEEGGWKALAMRQNDAKTEYNLVKAGNPGDWVECVEFT